MKKFNWVAIAIILISFIIGIFVYPRMPEMVASHWDDQGHVNGYLSKFWGTFLLPCIMAAIALLFAYIPKMDPMKENIKKFLPYYRNFIVILISFLFLIYLQTIAWSLGYKVSPLLILPVGLSILFYYVGVMIEHAERNWFIGIRTPWTMSSDLVWRKTHQIGGTMFKVVAGIMLIGVFFPAYAFYFVFIPVVFMSIFLMIYSYYLYQKEQK